MQPAAALMDEIDMDTDLPSRSSDAGPEDQPQSWDEWLSEAITAMREAQDTRMVRAVDGWMARAAECLARAREEWRTNR